MTCSTASRTVLSLSQTENGNIPLSSMSFISSARLCGIFCLSDLIAYGAQQCLAELGIAVPDDVCWSGSMIIR